MTFYSISELHSIDIDSLSTVCHQVSNEYLSHLSKITQTGPYPDPDCFSNAITLIEWHLRIMDVIKISNSKSMPNKENEPKKEVKVDKFVIKFTSNKTSEPSFETVTCDQMKSPMVHPISLLRLILLILEQYIKALNKIVQEWSVKKQDELYILANTKAKLDTIFGNLTYMSRNSLPRKLHEYDITFVSIKIIFS